MQTVTREDKRRGDEERGRDEATEETMESNASSLSVHLARLSSNLQHDGCNYLGHIIRDEDGMNDSEI